MSVTKKLDINLSKAAIATLSCFITLLLTTCGNKGNLESSSEPDGAGSDVGGWTAPTGSQRTPGGQTPGVSLDVIEPGEKKEFYEDAASKIGLSLKGGFFVDGAWVFYECSEKQAGSTSLVALIKSAI